MLFYVCLIVLFLATRVHAAPPNNDSCWLAKELYITMTGSTNTAQATSDGDSTCGTAGSKDVWYKYYATTTGFLTITTQGSDFDTVMSVHEYEISSCPGTDNNTVACNDDCIPGQPGHSCVNNMPVVEGHHYYIQVAGYSSATGNVSLSFGKATISGKVVDAATSQPIQGAAVYAKSRMDSAYPINYADTELTDASGNYSLVVPAGSYQISASKGNYLQEVYDGILCPDDCNATTGPAISVTNGQQVNSINFSLDLGGSVSGTVTDKETGAPLQGIVVYIDGNAFSNSFDSQYSASTDANGNYTVNRLPPGTYYPYVKSKKGYAPQLYNNIPCSQCTDRTDGNPVFVAAGTTTTGIDFTLIKGSIVSGIVIDELTGLPIENAAVGVRGVSEILTDATGHYSISGVPSGQQVLMAGGNDYVGELYNNVPCFWYSTCKTETGNMLTVPSNSNLTVNFALAKAGKITGTTFDETTSQPLSGTRRLALYNSNGTRLWHEPNSGGGPNFSFFGLASGTYFVVVGVTGYVTELYNNLPCPDHACNVLMGTPIQVVQGQTTSGINMELAPAGSISGQITVNGTPLDSALITVYNADGDVMAEAIEADDFGKYKVNGLPTGAYYVKAQAGRASTNKRYIPEVYNNVACVACVPHLDGFAVNVTAGVETTGINFSLNQGAAISGKVVGAIGGAPLGAKVSVFNAAGNLVSEVTTDGSGQYISKTGLTPGNYFIYADGGAGHTAEVYNDIPCAEGNCNLLAADQVVTAAGATTPNINFGLVDCAGLSLSPGTIPPMTEGQSYSQTFSAAGGQAPFLYSLAGGILPTGLSLSTDGKLTGSPEVGNFDFQLSVSDANGCKRSAGFSVSIEEVPCIYCDDFEDATPASDWSYAKGLWDEEGGALTTIPSGKTASAFAVPAFAGCTQCFMETSMQTSGGPLNKMWFFPWYQNKNNTVEVLMKDEANKWVIRHRVNGVIVSKGKGTGTITPGQFYTVRVNYTGSAFQLVVDGNVLTTIPAVSQPFGSVGYQVKNTIGKFGHVMVN